MHLVCLRLLSTVHLAAFRSTGVLPLLKRETQYEVGSLATLDTVVRVARTSSLPGLTSPMLGIVVHEKAVRLSRDPASTEDSALALEASGHCHMYKAYISHVPIHEAPEPRR